MGRSQTNRTRKFSDWLGFVLAPVILLIVEANAAATESFGWPSLPEAEFQHAETEVYLNHPNYGYSGLRELSADDRELLEKARVYEVWYAQYQNALIALLRGRSGSFYSQLPPLLDGDLKGKAVPMAKLFHWAVESGLDAFEAGAFQAAYEYASDSGRLEMLSDWERSLIAASLAYASNDPGALRSLADSSERRSPMDAYATGYANLLAGMTTGSLRYLTVAIDAFESLREPDSKAHEVGPFLLPMDEDARHFQGRVALHLADAMRLKAQAGAASNSELKEALLIVREAREKFDLLYLPVLLGKAYRITGELMALAADVETNEQVRVRLKSEGDRAYEIGARYH